MKKNTKQIIILALLILTMVFVLSACNNESTEIDLTDYVTVTYDCLGGRIDKAKTKTLYGKPGRLIVEPKGTQGLVEPERSGYTLEGWYTDFVERTYQIEDMGDFVYYYNFTLDETGEAEYVGYPHFYESNDGRYVKIKGKNGEEYFEEYNSDYDEHKDLTRYDMVMRYKKYNANDETQKFLKHYTAEEAYIYFDENNPDHQELQRYRANYKFDSQDKWDFKKTRLGNKPITLYANWVYNLNIKFYAGDETPVIYENGKFGCVIERGKTIKSYLPEKIGKTFTYWYKDPEKTQIWDFEKDVFPVDENIKSLYLYADYVKGDYHRVLNANDFYKYMDTDSKLLLINNIVLDKYDEIASGLDKNDIFTGEINGLGHTISGVNIIADRSGFMKNSHYGLFAKIENAKFNNLKIEATITIKSTSKQPLFLGAIAGEDLGNSEIENCNINLTMKSDGVCSSEIFLGAFVGKKFNTKIIDSEFNKNYYENVRTTGEKHYSD